MSKIDSVIDYWHTWLQDKANDWLGRYNSQTFIEIKNSQDIVEAFIGIRRSGKTTLACQQALYASNNIFYMNFEDPFFINNQEADIFDNLIDSYKNLYGKLPDILLLDEIQHINNWERAVRKYVDSKIFKVFITGSSAELLSSELVTSLTGRNIEHRIYPLSYREFLNFKQQTDLLNSNLNENLSQQHIQLLEEYFDFGAFPRVVLEQDRIRKEELLKQYFQDILFKDIVERYEVRSIQALKQVTNYWLQNISSKHSFNKVKNAFNITVATAQDYAEYLESAFMMFFIKKFDWNLKVQIRNPQKVYCIDSGLRRFNTFNISKDFGKLAENCVFLELKRQDKEIYYHQGDYELDFLIINHGRIENAINVTYCNLDDEDTYDREVSGVLEATQKYGLDQGIILTKTLNIEEQLQGKTIRFIPIFKFLLNSEKYLV